MLQKKMIKSATIALIFSFGVAAQDIDTSTPEGAIAAGRKIQCSLIDNKPILYTWEGAVFSRRMGEADKKLFNINGMNIRTCITIDGGKKGKGYRLVSREIMLYLDSETGKPLDVWHNPWTNTDVSVLQVANDPVNGRPSFPFGEDGNPAARFYGRIQNQTWFMTAPVPLFYHNELGGDYQAYVGGAYHATELFNFMGGAADLLDSSKDTAEDVQIGWVRLSSWLPWMEMQGREGIIYMQAAGQKINSFDMLPQVMQDYINEKEPTYKTPPPGDDMRPNVTSWTYFKNRIKGATLPRGGHN
jgi:hypothetical protein